MLRLAADENFNNDIVRGLLRRKPDLDIVRVQDVGLSGADDPTILEWAAQKDGCCLPMMSRLLRATLTSVFKQANPCLAFLRSAAESPLMLL